MPGCVVASGWEAAARAVLLAVVTWTPVLFLFPSLDVFEAVKTAFLGLAALALLVFAVAARAGSWRGVRADLRWLLRCPISLAVAFGGITALIATGLSISPRTSLFGFPGSQAGLATLLPAVVLFFASRALHADAARCRQTLAGIALALAVAGVYGLLQGLGRDPFPWDNTSAFLSWTRPSGTFGHSIWLAGYVVMALPLVGYLAWMAWQERQRRAALVGLVTIMLALTVLVMTLSRGAWLAAASAGLLVAIGLGRRIPRRWALTAAAGLLVMATIGLMAAWAAPQEFTSSLAGRVTRLGESPARWQVWTAAWQAFRDRPWTGHGPDTFGLLFPRYRTAAYWQLEWNHSAVRAHNDFLEALVTQGVLGGLAYLLLPLALAVGVYRCWRRGTNPALVLTLAAAMLAYYVQNLSGFAMSSCLSLFAVCAGMLSRLSEDEAIATTPASSKGWARVLVPALAGGLVVLFLVNLAEAGACRFTLRPVTLLVAVSLSAATGSYLAYRSGGFALRDTTRLDWSGKWRGVLVTGAVLPLAWGIVTAQVASCLAWRGSQELALPTATEKYRHAVAWAPHLDHLWRGLAGRLLKEAVKGRDERHKQRLLDEAEQAARTACDLVSGNGENYITLARVLTERRTQTGNDGAPLAVYDRALACDPSNSLYLADAGRAAVVVGDPERAERYLSRGLAVDQKLAELFIARAALSVLQGQLEAAAADLMHAAYSGCRWANPSESASQLRLLSAYVLLRLNRLDEAAQAANAELARNPDSLPAQAIHAQATRALTAARRRQ